MDFPVWDVGGLGHETGYGPLMALIAVVHVFLSHFAIGGGLALVLHERRARRTGDAALLAHVRRLSAFFAPTTLVVGAMTGVGIWFVIGLLNPTATGVLIRTFVWAWAIEWTMFAVEILAAILYVRGWDRLPARTHVAVGWVYFVAAWSSLVVINGIVTFMLTPGDWPATGSVADAFWNPTYAPSLALRTAVCVLLAGLFGLFVAGRERDAAARARLARGEAAVALAALVAAGCAFLWYRAALPGDVVAAVGPRLSIPERAVGVLGPTALALALGLALVVAWPRIGRRPAALALLALGFVAFGAFEWWREGARKPWAIPEVVHGNGLSVADVPAAAKRGALPGLAFRTGDDGRDLYLHECRSCHTLAGYNPILPALAGTDASFVEGLLGGLHKMRAKMPPFAGTAAERATLARWLLRRADPTPLATRAAREGRDLGDLVYAVRCGVCHVEGGFSDKGRQFEGLSVEDAKDLLGTVTFDEMPLFSGPPEELDALARRLVARTKGATR